MILLGFDLGSSFIKGSVVDSETGVILAQSQFPENEMQIQSPVKGWSEQNPELWWEGIVHLSNKLIQKTGNDISAIGISYQMHGLVLLDKEGNILRPSIIWSDNRAIEIGERTYLELGESFCQSHYQNSPGNFTGSRLSWVKENEPAIWENVATALLPGDYIAFKMSGEFSTTPAGLSEMILWDFESNQLAADILNYHGINTSIIPKQVPTFSNEIRLDKRAAIELGLPSNIPISYRAGDQLNNAMGLNVLQPGHFAATAGTSGVIYGIDDQLSHVKDNRINTFLHVNHSSSIPRYGKLLCINGVGIMNTWVKNNFGWQGYDDMNNDIKKSTHSKDILAFPFGNGAERFFDNQSPGASIQGIDLKRHDRNDIGKAVHEGICFAMRYGFDIMKDLDLPAESIKVSLTNMFLNESFTQAFSNLTDTPIDVFQTSGAAAAAMGAEIGINKLRMSSDNFNNLQPVKKIIPQKDKELEDQFYRWEAYLKNHIIHD